MSLRFSKVLGLMDDPNMDSFSTLKHKNDLNSNNNNNNDQTNNIKIEHSELQSRRARKIAKNTGVRFPNFITSFSMFNNNHSSQMNSLNKDQNDSTDLSHLPLSTSSPISLASHCINTQINKDDSVPSLYETLSMFLIDNYNLNLSSKTIDPFKRFEKVNFFNIPQKLLDSNNESIVTGMGMFSEIERAWLSTDDKLYIWNYNASFIDQEFDIVSDFNGTILKCQLVKPKQKVFVESVNYLIVVATSKEIKLLTLEYSNDNKKLIISDPQLSVTSHGMIINNIVYHEKSRDIYFTGIGCGTSVWKLKYSESSDWYSKSISKECLTEFSLTANLPSLPILNWLKNDTTNNNVEYIVDLKIDQSRHILYTLSSKSVIQAYRINNNKIGNPITKHISSLLKELSTTSPINIRSPLLKKSNLKLISIHPVSKNENKNLFLVVVASNGCRFYINGSTIYDDHLTLTTNFLKFPPMNKAFHEKISKRKENMLTQNQNINQNNNSQNQSYLGNQNLINQDSMLMNPTKSKYNSYFNSSINKSVKSDKSITKSVTPLLISPEELRNAQETSEILQNTSKSLIISPGIFVGFSEELGLYTSIPDYGIFKKDSQYIEDFEIEDKLSNIFEIVQLTESFNPVNQPLGYANEFASQYTKKPLEFAVLSNIGISVYRYRTPDLILEDSLDDQTFKKFALKYGSDEACSTALFLACKYDKSETFRNTATQYFISGGKNSKLDHSLSPIIDNVEPSDRFFAVLLLFSRLIRNVWDKEVFKLKSDIKYDKMGYIDVRSIKKLENKNSILENVNITKSELEFLLCSILIVINYFEDNKNIIPGLSNINNQNETTSWKQKVSEVCIQAEQICFDSISKFLNIVKEGLSFLAILLEDSHNDNTDSNNENFQKIISFLPIQLQADLSCITFADFFTKSDPNVSKLIKELLSCIINKCISEGNSVELVANTLQEKCGYFCSTDDVLIFKAVESLKQAKDYSDAKDISLKEKYLENGIKLLKQSGDSLSDEIIADCVNAILELGYYSNAVEFLLDIANTPELVKLSLQYQNDIQMSVPTDINKKRCHQRKLKLYHIIFQILIDVDKKAVSSIEKASNASLIGSTKDESHMYVDNEGHLVTYYSKLRDECYKICLNSSDKLLHFELYKWFIANGVSEKLLVIETPYILDFLRQESSHDLEMSKLLWIYYSKKGNYYEAACQLYILALSQFKIKLVDRIQFLSVANSFVQVIETQFVKQDIMELAAKINDLISVSNLQDELLITILQDSRVGQMAKNIAKDALDGEILTINELYNEYIDPLGYYELALVCFKLSDYRNREDVLYKWGCIFDKWFIEYKEKENHENSLFYIEIMNKFILIAEKVKDTEGLFTLTDLIPLILKSVYKHLENKSQKVPKGTFIEIFKKSGITYSKLYYNLKKVIESTTFELFEGYSDVLNEEMCYLIKDWYKNDKKLKQSINPASIDKLEKYTVNDDPIFNYIKSTGNPL